MKTIRLKVMFDRIKQYIGIVQFAMVAYIFIISTEWNLYTTLILISIISMVLAVVDFKWIYPAELNEISRRNPFMLEVLKRLEGIEKRLDK
jgi:hypothetical protein